jgi:hypothetical protein
VAERDVVTVPADIWHALMALFARVDHLSKSSVMREARDAVPERDRMRAQLVVFSGLVPVLRKALGVAISEARHAGNDADLRQYEDALKALGGEEGCDHG